MITIEELTKNMKYGFACKDETERWSMYFSRPRLLVDCGVWFPTDHAPVIPLSTLFDIAPSNIDWRESLIEIKGEEK